MKNRNGMEPLARFFDDVEMQPRPTTFEEFTECCWIWRGRHVKNSAVFNPAGPQSRSARQWIYVQLYPESAEEMRYRLGNTCFNVRCQSPFHSVQLEHGVGGRYKRVPWLIEHPDITARARLLYYFWDKLNAIKKEAKRQRGLPEFAAAYQSEEEREAEERRRLEAAEQRHGVRTSREDADPPATTEAATQEG